MTIKRVLCPERRRRVPRQFSWVDHRLVRDNHICGCSHEALALYLFLIIVADAEGLSYYSDKTVCRLLNLEARTLACARKELCRADLIAYRYPLYQVLSLDDPLTGFTALTRRGPRRGPGEAVAIGAVLRHVMGGGQ